MNILIKWCADNERPFKYLAEKAGIEYGTLYRHKSKSNEQLKSSLTFENVQKLKQVIPNIEEVLK